MRSAGSTLRKAESVRYRDEGVRFKEDAGALYSVRHKPYTLNHFFKYLCPGEETHLHSISRGLSHLLNRASSAVEVSFAHSTLH